MSDETFTLFWNGPFSQWEPSPFELDGVDYNCAEQFMMAEKARRFGDDATLELILEAEEPRTQKKLGRAVEDFDVDEWEEDQANGFPFCWNVVWRGSMAKFSQNPHLLRDLLGTRGTTLVEASPHDRIWGIGLRESDPGARDRSFWRGRNWLGEALTNAREHLSAHPGVEFRTSEALEELWR